MSVLLSHCDILYTDFRNNSLSSVSSALRHLRAVGICAAALNSRSTTAELDRVALLFGKKTKYLADKQYISSGHVSDYMCIDVTHMTDMRIVKQIIFINYEPLILIVIV